MAKCQLKVSVLWLIFNLRIDLVSNQNKEGKYMNIAKDGSAIIGGHVVRKEGVTILRALASFPVATYVPALSKSLGEVYSDQHLYSTLNRLCRLISPALCLKKVVFVEVLSTKIRRVTYEATAETRTFFAEISDKQK